MARQYIFLPKLTVSITGGIVIYQTFVSKNKLVNFGYINQIKVKIEVIGNIRDHFSGMPLSVWQAAYKPVLPKLLSGPEMLIVLMVTPY